MLCSSHFHSWEEISLCCVSITVYVDDVMKNIVILLWFRSQLKSFFLTCSACLMSTQMHKTCSKSDMSAIFWNLAPIRQDSRRQVVQRDQESCRYVLSSIDCPVQLSVPRIVKVLRSTPSEGTCRLYCHSVVVRCWQFTSVITYFSRKQAWGFVMPVVNLRTTVVIPSSGEYMLSYHGVVVCWWYYHLDFDCYVLHRFDPRSSHNVERS